MSDHSKIKQLNHDVRTHVSEGSLHVKVTQSCKIYYKAQIELRLEPRVFISSSSSVCASEEEAEEHAIEMMWQVLWSNEVKFTVCANPTCKVCANFAIKQIERDVCKHYPGVIAGLKKTQATLRLEIFAGVHCWSFRDYCSLKASSAEELWRLLWDKNQSFKLCDDVACETCARFVITEEKRRAVAIASIRENKK
jgi:hypothetical protein